MCRLLGAEARGSILPKKKFSTPSEGSFGKRLASLRQAAGLSQRKLAKVSGISQRMIAHYEGRAPLPPGHVLAALAEALGITVDALAGLTPELPSVKRNKASTRILRRLTAMEELPLKDKRELLAIIDTYLEKNRLLERGA